MITHPFNEKRKIQPLNGPLRVIATSMAMVCLKEVTDKVATSAPRDSLLALQTP